VAETRNAGKQLLRNPHSGRVGGKDPTRTRPRKDADRTGQDRTLNYLLSSACCIIPVIVLNCP